MKKIILHTENLEIGYPTKNGFRILQKNIQLTAKKNEFICLMGENGIGKSTLLKALAGLEESANNRIFWQAKKIESYNLLEQAKFRSIVVTKRILNSLLTVKEILSMGLYPHGFYCKKNKAHEERMEQITTDCGIYHLMQNTFSTLSDGEAQMVMIARALVQNTPLIFLDEPTAYLDVQNQIKIFTLLQKVCHENNKTVIMATHDLHNAIAFADKFWLLQCCIPPLEGRPEDFVLDGSIANTFEGSGHFNALHARFEAQTTPVNSLTVCGSDIGIHWLRTALSKYGRTLKKTSEEDAEVTIKTLQHKELNQQGLSIEIIFMDKTYQSIDSFIKNTYPKLKPN